MTLYRVDSELGVESHLKAELTIKYRCRLKVIVTGPPLPPRTVIEDPRGHTPASGHFRRSASSYSTFVACQSNYHNALGYCYGERVAYVWLMLARRQFYKFFLATRTAAVASNSAWPAAEPSFPVDQGRNQNYDLLIKGGTVIDPGQGLHAALDVAVSDGKCLKFSLTLMLLKTEPAGYFRQRQNRCSRPN
jgi:hypothetical protein